MTDIVERDDSVITLIKATRTPNLPPHIVAIMRDAATEIATLRARLHQLERGTPL